MVVWVVTVSRPWDWRSPQSDAVTCESGHQQCAVKRYGVKMAHGFTGNKRTDSSTL